MLDITNEELTVVTVVAWERDKDSHCLVTCTIERSAAHSHMWLASAER